MRERLKSISNILIKMKRYNRDEGTGRKTIKRYNRI